MIPPELTDPTTPGEQLPDFAAPPVVEIVGTVQFNPLPSLSVRDMVNVGGRLGGYELRNAGPGRGVRTHEREPGGTHPAMRVALPSPCVPETEALVLQCLPSDGVLMAAWSLPQ
jgi:hypothetical protein